jgi:hypothetical protein
VVGPVRQDGRLLLVTGNAGCRQSRRCRRIRHFVPPLRPRRTTVLDSPPRGMRRRRRTRADLGRRAHPVRCTTSS